MATNVEDFFKIDDQSPAALRAKAQAIIQNESTIRPALGSRKPIDQAQFVLGVIDDYETLQQRIASEGGTAIYNQKTGQTLQDRAQRKLDIITSGLSLSDRLLGKLKKTQGKALADVANTQESIANLTDFSDPNLSSGVKDELTNRARSETSKLAQLQGKRVLSGIDTNVPLTRLDSGYVASSSVPQSRVGKQQAAGTFNMALQSGPVNPSTDLLARVEATSGGLVANDAFINAAFQAYHGRDANAEELARFAGQSTEDVRSTVRAGSAKSGVLSGATGGSAGDRLLGPEEFERLRKELGVSPANFDQFFRRDSRGNIYLKAEAFGSDREFRAEAATEQNADTLLTSELQLPSAPVVDETQSFVESMRALWDAAESPEMRALQEERDAYKKQLTDLTDQSLEKSEDTQEILDQYGYSENFKKLQDLNLKITQKMAEYDQLSLDIDQQTIPNGLLVGQQSALMRQKALDVGVLTSQALALQGNIELATTVATQMIDLKYQPIEQAIENTKTFLDLNSDDLSREEGKQVATINLLLSERSRILEEQKEEQKLITELMVNVAEGGGDPSMISFDKSFAENVRIAAPFLEYLTLVESGVFNNGGFDGSGIGTYGNSYGSGGSLTGTYGVGGTTGNGFMDSSGKFIATQGSGGTKSGGSVSWRHNNPLNIKFGDFAASFGATQGQAATDGGAFAAFPDTETGLAAGVALLKSASYKSLPLESAMRRWSGSGYGADVAPALPANATVGSLDESQLEYLVGSMAQREGWSEGQSGGSGIPFSQGMPDSIFVQTSDKERKALIESLDAKGAPDALLGAVISGTVSPGDASYLNDTLQSLKGNLLLTDDEIDSILVSASTNGAQQTADYLNQLVGVKESDIASVMLSRGISRGEALDLAVKDRPRFTLEVANAERYTIDSKDKLLAILASVKNTPDLEERKRLYSLLIAARPESKELITTAIGMGLVKSNLTAQENELFLRGLDAIVNAIYPTGRSSTARVYVPGVSAVNSRGGSLDVGDRYFASETPAEVARASGAKAVRGAYNATAGALDLLTKPISMPARFLGRLSALSLLNPASPFRRLK